jgi:hypothetical protein
LPIAVTSIGFFHFIREVMMMIICFLSKVMGTMAKDNVISRRDLKHQRSREGIGSQRPQQLFEERSQPNQDLLSLFEGNWHSATVLMSVS